jgi:WD40 repeat protein
MVMRNRFATHASLLLSATTLLLASSPALCDEPRVDLYGDPLPPKALVRLGTVRFRQNKEINSLVVSPDGKMLASGADFEIALWDLTTGKLLRNIQSQGPKCCALGFSADSKQLFGASLYLPVALNGAPPGYIKAWDSATGQELRDFKGHEEAVEAAGISADGKIIVSYARDASIRVWDTASGKQIRRFGAPEIHREMKRTIALSPNGQMFAFEHDESIRVIDVNTGKLLHKFPSPDWTSAVLFAPDSRSVILTQSDGIRAYDLTTGKKVAEREWEEQMLSGAGLLSPNEAGKLSALEGIVWTRPVGKLRLAIIGGFTAATFTPDGKVLIAADEDGHIKLWRTADGAEIEPAIAHDGSVTSGMFFRDGVTAATAGSDGTVRFWDARTGKQLARIDRKNGDGVFRLTASDREAIIYRDEAQQTIRILGLKTPQGLAVCADGSRWETPAVLMPCGTVFAGPRSSYQSYDIEFKDLQSGKEARALSGLKWKAGALAFSPDGRFAAIGGPNESLCLWDVQKAKRLIHFKDERKLLDVPGLNFEARTECVPTALTFSPDGRFLAAGITDQVVLWDIAVEKAIAVSAETRRPVRAIAFSPDGRLLASNGNGLEPIQILEAPTLSEITHFAPDHHEVNSLSFSPDGRRLLSASTDSTALIWDVVGLAGEAHAGEAELSRWQTERAWECLADPDTSKAWQAIRSLTLAPRQALPMLRERLRPTTAAPQRQLADWLSDLESPRFAARENASREIEKLGDCAEEDLRKLLTGNPAPEARRRAEVLLAKLWPAPAALRTYRALAVLEYVGSDEARTILADLAKGAANARFTREAKAALERLDRNPQRAK